MTKEQRQVLRNFVVEANILAKYREHAYGCELDRTDFCTCGLGATMRRFRQLRDSVEDIYYERV